MWIKGWKFPFLGGTYIYFENERLMYIYWIGYTSVKFSWIPFYSIQLMSSCRHFSHFHICEKVTNIHVCRPFFQISSLLFESEKITNINLNARILLFFEFYGRGGISILCSMAIIELICLYEVMLDLFI